MDAGENNDGCPAFAAAAFGLETQLLYISLAQCRTKTLHLPTLDSAAEDSIKGEHETTASDKQL